MILKLPYLRPIPKLQPLKKRCTTKAPFMRPCRAADQQFMACSDSHQPLHGPATGLFTTNYYKLIGQRKGKAEAAAFSGGTGDFELPPVELDKIATKQKTQAGAFLASGSGFRMALRRQNLFKGGGIHTHPTVYHTNANLLTGFFRCYTHFASGVGKFEGIHQ